MKARQRFGSFILASEAGTHGRVSELLLVAVPLLIYLVLKLLGPSLILLDIVEYTLTEFLMAVLIVEQPLSRIVIVHQLIILGANELHVPVLIASYIYHFLLLLFTLFAFLHALDCLPSYAVADRLAAATENWEGIKPRVVAEDLL